VENLIVYCMKNIGWRLEETKRFLDPIVESARNRHVQTRLDKYMRRDDNIKFANVRSKRLRNVLRLSSEADGDAKQKPPKRQKK
jgi:hypothetical protein